MSQGFASQLRKLLKRGRLEKLKGAWALGAIIILTATAVAQTAKDQAVVNGRWSVSKARLWSRARGTFNGVNYLPSTAVNQLEMWQAETFDKATIDRELGWAHGLGMGALRVFLHDLPWRDDPRGFRRRITTFLSLADKHHLKIIFVLFDSCWAPHPRAGRQPAPRPGVHNSRWVQSPGMDALQSAAENRRLKIYVHDVVEAFAHDPRVLAWDVWNEPANTNEGTYDDPETKLTLVQNLLPQVFAWVRSAHPDQPLTSGVVPGRRDDAAAEGRHVQSQTRNRVPGMYRADFMIDDPIRKIQLENSDVISFHDYGPADDFESDVKQLLAYHRPLFCTEYMARPLGSTFQNIMPVGRRYNIGLFNWGLVAGKSQTYLSWDTWDEPADRLPPVWFHDIFYADGTPYDKNEVAFIRGQNGRSTLPKLQVSHREP